MAPQAKIPSSTPVGNNTISLRFSDYQYREAPLAEDSDSTMEEEGDRPREQISAMMFRVRSIDLDEFKNSFKIALGYRKPSITKKNILDSKLSKKEDIKINKPKIVEKVEAKTFRQIDYSVLRKADNVEDYINMMYDFIDINFGKEANFDDKIVMQHIDERKYRDSSDKEAFSLDCFKTGL